MIEPNKIYCGNSLEILKTFPDESINCIMTSPPYWNLRDYQTEGIVWDGDKDCKHKWNEVSTTNNFCSKCGAWKGSLGLEPTFDLYIKHLCDIFNEVKRVLRKDGTCWVNISDTYGKINKKMEKSLCNIPARFSIEMQNNGWILRNVIIWHKPSCMPSSVKDRFTVDFEYVFFFVKNKEYWFETQYEPHNPKYANDWNKTNERKGVNWNFKTKDRKTEGRTRSEFYGENGRNKRTVWSINPKPFKESHFAVFPEELCETPLKAGCPEFICNKCGKPRKKIYEYKRYATRTGENVKANIEDPNGKWIGKGIRTRQMCDTKEIGFSDCKCNANFSGGLVLDPFFGAGTVGVIAIKQNKNFIGIELNPKYIEIAKRRLKPYLEQRKL